MNNGTKVKKMIVLVLLLSLLTTIVDAKQVSSKVTVSGDFFGFGQKIQQVTYIDGSIEYVVSPGILSLLSIDSESLSTVQGYKIYQDGSLADMGKITITDSSYSSRVYITNPYLVQQINAGKYTVSVSEQGEYTVLHSFNCCVTDTTWILGDKVIVDAPSGGYVNLWFKFVKGTTPLPTPPNETVGFEFIFAIVGIIGVFLIRRKL